MARPGAVTPGPPALCDFVAFAVTGRGRGDSTPYVTTDLDVAKLNVRATKLDRLRNLVRLLYKFSELRNGGQGELQSRA